MTDKKISQLTGATTPLAGTEVLPIVQSGSTVKVSAADITAGRNVAALGLTLTNNLEVGGTFALNTTSPATYFHLVGDDADISNPFAGIRISRSTSLKAAQYGVLSQASGAATLLSTVTTGSAGGNVALRSSADGSTSKLLGLFSSNNNVSFYEDTGTTAKFVWDATAENLSITGNYVVGTAGKGIDFSANTGAAGKTSQLLDDYEEGTWTPTYQPTTGSFTSITYNNTGGVYTKIGNICIVSGYVATSALDTTGGSGAVRVGGLPYGVAGSSGGTRDAWRGGSIGYSAGWSGERPSSVFATGGSSTFALMYRTNATSDSAYVDVSDMDTSGANEIAFALVYKV